MDKIKKAKRAARLCEWAEMYRLYKESGKTVAQWCSEQNLSVKTFYYRLRKIREAALESQEKHEIVPISPKPVIKSQNELSCIKISGNGISVELPENISPETITAILQGVEIMLKEMQFSQVYLVCGYTDMRRGIDGLAGIVKQNYGLEPCSGSLFLFCGRRRDRLKALLWEDDGFLLMYKRLDNGGFQWPRSEPEARLLTQEQYVWLMQGLSTEQPKAIRKAEKHKDIV